MKENERGTIRVLAAWGLVTAAWVAAPNEAQACSICRCGDPTFNALGTDSYAARGVRLALDWERFDKQEGNPAESAESQVENRLTALASYGWGDKLTLFARLPYSVRSQTVSSLGAPAERVHTHGLSDPEAYAQLRLWGSRLAGGVGQRASLSANLGVKLPWGENEAQAGGVRADEHVQPGTGSTDAFGSLAFLYLINPRSALFASSGYRRTGENAHHYRYGSSFLANLAYEHKLGSRLDGIVELNFRNARRDRVDASGQLDNDTGGALLYLTPRLLMSLGKGLVARAGAQLPVARSLNGYQKERPVLNVGLTYLFTFMH